MQKLYSCIGICCMLLLSISCSHKKADNDWITSNDVKIAVDETLKPIMSEEFQQFGLTNVEATVQPIYCSEDSALHLLLDDSVRSIVITRKLTPVELDRIHQAGHAASQSLIASDAFALIVNKENPDSLISLSEIKGIVTGKITRWEQLKHSTKTGDISLVFDDSRSSTVRYMRDSLCGGKNLSGNVYAQGSNLAVIDAVKANPNAIGVVGTDWLRGKEHEALSSFKGLDVNVMLIAGTDEEFPQYYRPYQYYIGTGDYPLVRSIYVITTDPRTQSMERKLYFWLKGQRGQTIICNNSQLLPATPVQVRDVKITK